MIKNKEQDNNIYLILDGNKTTDKFSFLNELSLLLNLPKYSNEKADFVWNWDEIQKHLKNIVDIWQAENPSYVKTVSNKEGALPLDLKVNIIWLDPINFGIYNQGDLLIAIDILKEITEDKLNPLIFILAANISTVNTDLYKQNV